MRISVQQASQKLLDGHVVAIPTETVYGLAASVSHPEAIQRIFSLKRRPLNNPLIIHVADRMQIDSYVETYPEKFSELCDRFWPGPLTVVIPVKMETLPSVIRAGLPTAAFRLPNHPVTRAVIAETGPLVMPSANLSGKPSATVPEHVEQDFGSTFPVLDGGPCQHGLESTILIWSGSEWVIGRLGAIAGEEFAPILGYAPQFSNGKSSQKPICPGQHYRHYAPKAKLYLTDEIPHECRTVLGFEENSYPKEKRIIYLGSLDSPSSVARNLYHNLRLLDNEGIAAAWIDLSFPNHGLWESIRERLLKASQ